MMVHGIGVRGGLRVQRGLEDGSWGLAQYDWGSASSRANFQSSKLNFEARYQTTFLWYRDDFRGTGGGPILAQSRFIAVVKRLQSVLRYHGFICDFIIFYTFQYWVFKIRLINLLACKSCLCSRRCSQDGFKLSLLVDPAP